VPQAGKKLLEDLLRDDVLKLEKIIGRPLPWFHRAKSAA
jgi:hypothetical protein